MSGQMQGYKSLPICEAAYIEKVWWENKKLKKDELREFAQSRKKSGIGRSSWLRTRKSSFLMIQKVWEDEEKHDENGT